MFSPEGGFYHYPLIEIMISSILYHLLFSCALVKGNAFFPFLIFISELYGFSLGQQECITSFLCLSPEVLCDYNCYFHFCLMLKICLLYYKNINTADESSVSFCVNVFGSFSWEDRMNQISLFFFPCMIGKSIFSRKPKERWNFEKYEMIGGI